MVTAIELSNGWFRGFPEVDGTYQVLLNDGEQIITPWSDGSGFDGWGEKRIRGWPCLSDWAGRVLAWRTLPEPPVELKRNAR